MKIALQTGLIPGGTIEDKQRWAADHGVEGLEIGSGECSAEKADATLHAYENSPVPVVSICGNPSFDFLDPSKEKRRKSIDECKQVLSVAGRLGAVGQIVPPIFGPPRLPDLSPLEDPITLEKRLLVPIVQELGDAAQAANTLLLLEPLNRYEQHLLRRQADGVEIVERAGHPSVAVISDFFHMHIEETDTPAALRAAGRHVRHVHLADNTRQEPGTGDIDFVAGFRALRDIGFDGYMAYECGVTGGDASAKEAALIKSLEYVRGCIAQATKE
uniref:D-tagatose 3-epimerase n=1 Tax=uncultured Armatimonadetes bacterium TaxID=157466 RepID=A0A6J4HFI6_9BACT|nr:D-tagatose 3-epimerase [uncultured Armatimonadetes bacterium]